LPTLHTSELEMIFLKLGTAISITLVEVSLFQFFGNTRIYNECDEANKYNDLLYFSKIF
jgi:hypothetical protein